MGGLDVPLSAGPELLDPARIGTPGAPPYTRGIFADGYQGRLWTIRQYSGFGTAEDTNARYRFL
ncbi:MAG: methylmalonyl-CoA mutase family protein, partial [Gammaproteobacteria bacterium]